MQCLIETCDYNAKHDADMSEHANVVHGTHFRRGREGAEFVYLVYPRGMEIQKTHYVGDRCPGGHFDPTREMVGE